MTKVVFQISWGKGIPIKPGIISGCLNRNKAGSWLNTVSVWALCRNRNSSTYFKENGISYTELGP